jgi:hypothetical protein
MHCSTKAYCHLQVLDEKWSSAEAHLEQAFADCDKAHAKNCGAILSYLVPVRILRGQMPSAAMMEVLPCHDLPCVCSGLAKWHVM